MSTENVTPINAAPKKRGPKPKITDPAVLKQMLKDAKADLKTKLATTKAAQKALDAATKAAQKELNAATKESTAAQAELDRLTAALEALQTQAAA